MTSIRILNLFPLRKSEELEGSRLGGNYTAYGDEWIDKRIESHLQVVSEEILREVRPISILLIFFILCKNHEELFLQSNEPRALRNYAIPKSAEFDPERSWSHRDQTYRHSSKNRGRDSYREGIPEYALGCGVSSGVVRRMAMDEN
jgi:hypothetical protein